MLHLQAGVHLKKIKAAVARQQKFHSARTHVVHRPGSGHCSCPHARAQGIVDRRAGRLFHQFLMPPLHRAVALADMHQIAMPVAKHLDLNMPRLQYGFFDQQLPIAEGIDRFAASRLDGGQQISRILHHPHAAPTAAGCSFDHHRQADLDGLGQQAGITLCIALVARNAAHTGSKHAYFGAAFIAHGLNSLPIRPDKHQAGGLHCLRKI